MLSKRTRYAIILAAAIERTRKRLDAENAAPKFKLKGIKKKHGVPTEYEKVPVLDQVPFWEAAMICLEHHFVTVTTMAGPEDGRLDRYIELGPWGAMVALAKQATGEAHYATAIIAHAHFLAPPADEGNVVTLALRRG